MDYKSGAMKTIMAAEILVQGALAIFFVGVFLVMTVLTILPIVAADTNTMRAMIAFCCGPFDIIAGIFALIFTGQFLKTVRTIGRGYG